MTTSNSVRKCISFTKKRRVGEKPWAIVEYILFYVFNRNLGISTRAVSDNIYFKHFHCPNISHSLSSLYNKIPRVSELPIMSNPVILRVCSSFICFKCLLLSLLASLEFNSKYYVCRGCLALKGTVY